MAVETVQQITRPPEFIEAEAKLYLDQLRPAIAGQKAGDLSQIYGPQYVAGLGQLTQDAISAAGGLGSYAPYLQTAAGLSGPTAYQQFMSPYQQDVINATLGEYDIQAQKGIRGIADQAIAAGAFGGGREGVQRAEYMAASDRNRAALQAQLLQQGFGQAQQLAGQAFGQQLNLAQAAPQLAGQQIAGLSTLGAQQQAQAQAGLTAQQQLAQQQLMQPLTAAQQYGSGVTSLIAGYPGTTQQTSQPGPSPVSTALGIGSTLAGIYRAINPPTQTYKMI
jgi:hypothetical protein